MKRQEVTKFELGQYVLEYPNNPPDKLSALDMNRSDIAYVRDLTTDEVSVIHTMVR